MKETYQVIGVMSGSSMDGVDLACCEFRKSDSGFDYRIVAAETFPYSDQWRVRLSQLNSQSAEIFHRTHVFYGRYLGQLIQRFCNQKSVTPDFVSSHGHTIFHRPELGYTAQIGDGASIAAWSGLPVVCDFRSMDLALGGQGAPLVPVGDRILFPEYEACLNLGGISNISFTGNGKSRAFDISPCNIVLNRVARWLGQSFDDKGRIAASADPDPDLLEDLDNLDYYKQNGAKSLGREWINEHFWPIVKSYPDTSEQEKMATLSLHIACKIAEVINHNSIRRILVTGGGAFNEHLIQNIRSKTAAELVIPQPDVVNFKEALIFAFLGMLRVRNEINVLSSVTGSSANHIGGCIYGNYLSLI